MQQLELIAEVSTAELERVGLSYFGPPVALVVEPYCEDDICMVRIFKLAYMRAA